MRCDFCKEEFNQKAEQGITYVGIDEHHNPPQFMFEDNEKWTGEYYNLCRKNQRQLHDEIIKILNEELGTLKFVNSEHQIWIRMNLIQRKKSRERVYEFTKKWIGDNDKNTKTNREL